jgi:peroxiredoxin
MVTIGQKAPDFAATALRDGEGVVLELFEVVRAHEAIVLYFYPADFVAEATAELTAMRDAGWHTHEGLAVIGLSGDSLFSHAAYAREHEIPFALVSDFHGHVADSYDLVIQEWEGHTHIPGRAAVVVDDDWNVEALEQADPLAWADPAPVEAITETVQSAGVDVEQPNVSYE